MRRLPKKWPVALYVSSVVLAVAFMSLATVFADTKPYFKSFGGDVFSGGWFIRSGTCSTAAGSNYQDNRYGSPANDYYGGILAYAKADGSNNPAGGASSQYAVLADGKVEYRGSPDLMGFYSNGALAFAGIPGGTTNAVKSRTFSNTVSPPDWGGLFQGSIRQSHCIPDYYNKMPPGVVTKNPLTEPLNSYGTGAYKITPTAGSNYNLVTADRTIVPNEKISVFVDGSVYIGSNIIYDSTADADSVQKFVLVARGNIYIGPGVTRLDGYYIAQPVTDNPGTPAADDGNLWTCHPNDQAALGTGYLNSYPGCRTNKLVINGAVVAKQVNFMRAPGDVVGANTTEDSLNNAVASLNVAEVINYTPTMVIGGPFFNPPTTTTLKVDSLINLPPSL